MDRSSLHLHGTLRGVLSALIPAVADYGFLHLVDDDGRAREVAVKHRDSGREGRLMRVLREIRPRIVESGALIGHVMETGRPQRIEGPAARRVIESIPADRDVMNGLREFLPRAFLVLPLRGESDAVLGALSLARAETDLRFTDREVVFLGVVARQAGMAIGNARLLEASLTEEKEKKKKEEEKKKKEEEEKEEEKTEAISPEEEEDDSADDIAPGRQEAPTAPAEAPAAPAESPAEEALRSLHYLAGGLGEYLGEHLREIKEEFVVRMLEVPEDDPLRGSFHGLARSVDRASSILSGLVDFSRARTEEAEEVGLDEVLTEVVAEMEEEAADVGVEIKVEVDPDVGEVRVGERGLYRAVREILRNGLEAMPEGGRLRISSSAESVSSIQAAASPYPPHPGSYARVRVRDDGPGMAADVLGRAFEPFFTTKDRDDHPGLGLTTVFGITKLTRGHLWLESWKDGGTRVDLYFPIAGKKEEADARAKREGTKKHRGGEEERDGGKQPKRAGASGGETGGRGEEEEGETTTSGAEETTSPTVLLFESQADARARAAGMFRRAGLRVLEASSETEALDLWRRIGEEVDALIIDADSGPTTREGAGNKSLLELSRMIRPGLPVLYASRMPRMDRAFPEMLDGTIRFVEKPFREDQLMRKLGEFLQVPPDEERSSEA